MVLTYSNKVQLPKNKKNLGLGLAGLALSQVKEIADHERVISIKDNKLEQACQNEAAARSLAGLALSLKVKEIADHEWVISIKDKLDQACQNEAAGSWAKLSIYRIPKSLREGDDRAYVPQIVSLGPYHGQKCKDMDKHKWRSLNQVLKRTKHDIKLYLDSMKGLEEKARSCYEGPIILTSNEFVEMMVLDGCFIVELLRGAGADDGFEELGYLQNDPVFAMHGFMRSIQRDMIMLENQVPLFVLDRLLGLQIGTPDQKGLVSKHILRFFYPLIPTNEPLSMSDQNKLESSDSLNDQDGLHCVDVFRRSLLLRTGPQPPPINEPSSMSDQNKLESSDSLNDQDGLHCADVFRRSLLRTGPQPPPKLLISSSSPTARVADKRRQQLIHCVTELRESGIKFKKRTTDQFWDIKFEDGILHIPRLLIQDGTKSLFLNLIAFEQCHLDCSNEITTYVIFMDNLINSPEDVGYLHYCGIIEHWLGNNGEVSDLFNRLCQEVVFDINDSYLSQLSEQVNLYYNRRWNTWRASLKHNYFNNPWAIISFLAAVILLLLTFAQTFYGVYGYYNPRD